MRGLSIRRLILATFLTLAFAILLAAQGLEITGTVRDEAGMPLAGVTVRLITRTQGIKIGGTNGKGQFTFRDLGNGSYQLAFEKDGYVPQTRIVDVTYDKNDDEDGYQVVLVHEKKPR